MEVKVPLGSDQRSQFSKSDYVYLHSILSNRNLAKFNHATSICLHLRPEMAAKKSEKSSEEFDKLFLDCDNSIQVLNILTMIYKTQRLHGFMAKAEKKS